MFVNCIIACKVTFLFLHTQMKKEKTAETTYIKSIFQIECNNHLFSFTNKNIVFIACEFE